MVNNINTFISKILMNGDKFLKPDFKNILNNLKYNLAITQNFITHENVNYFYLNFLKSANENYKLNNQEIKILNVIKKHIKDLSKKAAGK